MKTIIQVINPSGKVEKEIDATGKTPAQLEALEILRNYPRRPHQSQLSRTRMFRSAFSVMTPTRTA